MSTPVEIRPLASTDIAAADAMAWDALRRTFEHGPIDEERRARFGRSRIAHLLATDRGGAWVADAGGEIVGISLALMREGIWGFSLFAVAPPYQSRGIGHRLLDAALDYGAQAQGALILSTTDARAIRRYARAGFDLHPCVSGHGVVDAAGLPGAPRVRDVGAAGIPLANAIGRAVRGAAHGVDLEHALSVECRLLLCEDRGFAVHRDGRPVLVAALEEDAATELLGACLAQAPANAEVDVNFLTAEQGWAVDVCLGAGLRLQPDGPLFRRGELGPLRPYIPSGAYL